MLVMKRARRAFGLYRGGGGVSGWTSWRHRRLRARRATGSRPIARDAELLARLLLAGQLSAVRVPEARMEARRELFRCHEQARGELMRARHRTSKMLLRHGRVWSEGSSWTQRHRAWLARQQFEQTESELVFADYLASIDAAAAARGGAR